MRFLFTKPWASSYTVGINTLTMVILGLKIFIYILLLSGVFIQKTEAPKCQLDSLPPGVKIAASCKAEHKEVCSIKCVFNRTIIWQTQIRCLSGKWSSMPYCHGATVEKSLEMVNCKNLPMNVEGQAYCLKITQKITRKNKCPDLISLKFEAIECSRDPGSYCKVSCSDGKLSTLKCLPNGQWSNIPKCVTVKQTICSEPPVIKLLNCSRKEGERCKFQCPDGEVVNEEAICQPTGVWSLAFPNSTRIKKYVGKDIQSLINKCKCPTPHIESELIFEEDCSRKVIGESCQLGCKKHFAIIGNENKIYCQPNLTWSALPKCSDKTCPVPELPESLAFEGEDCGSKLPGETCSLRCIGFSLMKQKRPFRCKNGTHWTKFPVCVCNPPVLPENIATNEDCKGKKVGSTCKLKCKEKFFIAVPNFITCQINGTWTPTVSCHSNICVKPDFPQETVFTEDDCSVKRVGEFCKLRCIKVPESYEIVCQNNTLWSSYPKCSCPSPSFSKNIEVQEDCSMKKPGDKCKVSCKDSLSLKKHIFVKCRSNSEWDSEPSCDKFICNTPILPHYLLLNEDCSHKGDGDKCHLACKMGGEFLTKDYIVCLKGKHWTSFPSCTCPKPKLRNDLELTEDCSLKKTNETCKLRCRKKVSTSSQDHIICLKDTTWSDQPSCSEDHCPDPVLPEYMLVHRQCSGTAIGGTCEVFCKGNRKVIGPNIITCLDNLKWSPFPLCTCERPQMPLGVQLLEDCENAQPSKECRVKCQGQMKLLGNKFIRCLKNASWSVFPKCSHGTCEEPQIPEYLTTSESCINKNPGDQCQVKCKMGGIVIGNNNIVCLNHTHWSAFPLCTCSKPLLKSNLRSLTDCDGILPGKKCFLSCENNTRMIGNEFIICKNDTTWSDQPVCHKLFCRRPILNPLLELDGVCTSKEPGDECSVKCKEGQLIGSPTIKCLNLTAWSKSPDCGCLPPLLDENFEMLHDCSQKKKGEKCELKCKDSKILIGKPYITCQNNVRWSSQPMCRFQFCRKPNLPGKVLETTEDCSTKVIGETCELRCVEGGKIIGSDTIICLNESKWTAIPECSCPKPDLPDNMRLVEKCDDVTKGTKCKVACKEYMKLVGNEWITCLETTKWSPLPFCTTSFCPEPRLPRNILISNEDCSFKTADEVCEIQCENGGQLLGKNFITCLNGTRWSALPECTCPKPELDEVLEIINEEGCHSKKRGEICNLRCISGKKLAGKSYIICQNNSQWSSQPVCRPEFCVKPFLRGRILETEEDCSSKLIGETCALRCIEGGNIIGSATIKCLSKTMWSELPVCTCPRPELPDDMLLLEECINKTIGMRCKVGCKRSMKLIGKNTIICNTRTKWSSFPICVTIFCKTPLLPNGVLKSIEDCSSKTVNESCRLACEKGGRLIGKNHIVCLSDTNWSNYPDCTCKEPKLNNDLIISEGENCSSKKRGESCTLKCKNGKRMSGRNNTICLNNTEWSSLPRCQEFCQTPRIPSYLKFIDKCSSKLAGESCRLSCLGGGSMEGQNIITCLSNLTWSFPPKCTCPPLDPNAGLVGDCESIKPGEKCRIMCKDPFSTTDKDVILCNRDGKWTNQFVCKKARCRMIQTHPASAFEGKCESMLAGEVCNLRCKGSSGGIIRSVRCNKDGNWTQPEKCVCPPVTSLEDLEILDTCTDKGINQTCRLKCKNGLDLKEHGFITCDSSLRWTSAPSCHINFCPTPRLPRGSKVVEGNCTRLRIGMSCKIICLHGGILNGLDTIFCDAERKLSKIPTCTCKEPLVREPVKLYDACKGKEVGENCPVYCESNPTTSYKIQCLMQENWMWSSVPNCPCYYPKDLNPYVMLQPECAKLTVFPINITCPLFCENSGNLAFGSSITCLPGSRWSTSPKCACAPPEPPPAPSSLNLTRCTLTLPGTSCPVSCTSGRVSKNFMHCNTSYFWDDYAVCKKDSCPDPRAILEAKQVGLDSDCQAKTEFIVGIKCDLVCLNGGISPRPKTIECLANSTWSSSARCPCPPPKVIEHYSIDRTEKGACRNKFKGENCTFSCTGPGYGIKPEKKSLICRGTFWDGELLCERIGMWCSAEDLLMRKLLFEDKDCAGQETIAPNVSCTVKCLSKTSLLKIPHRDVLAKTAVIFCANNGTWSYIPECTCPLLQVPPPLNLTAHDCSLKTHMEKCPLTLHRGYKFKNSQHNYIQCIDGKWREFPEYEPLLKCARPPSAMTDPLLRWPQECNDKFVGELCQVSCVEPALFENSTSTFILIQCTQVAESLVLWSAIPPCVCPTAISSGNYVMQNCERKKVSDRCQVYCIAENVYTYTSCTTTGTWSVPDCRRIRKK